MPLRLHDLEVDTRRHDPAARGGGGHELSHLARHRHVHAAACRDVPWSDHPPFSACTGTGMRWHIID
eukprot:1019671-Rhodomonas_salina.2